MIRTDSEIKRDVEDELKYDAGVDSTDIGVAVKDGVVSLTGFVRSYSQKLQAEMDAKRISGVMAVANDLEVRLASADSRPDPEIARDLVAQLKFELPYSHERIKSVVKGGWVTLEGDLEWNYQRTRAENTALPLAPQSPPMIERISLWESHHEGTSGIPHDCCGRPCGGNWASIDRRGGYDRGVVIQSSGRSGGGDRREGTGNPLRG